MSLERLAESQGVELARKGGDLVGLCPFHADKEPSLVITPAKNLWHCLGACRADGSVIDWVMRAEGVSFRHAAELLQTDYQPSRVSSGSVKRSTAQKLPTAFEGNAEERRSRRRRRLRRQVRQRRHRHRCPRCHLRSPRAMKKPPLL